MDSPEATRTKSSAQSPPLQVTPFPPIPTPKTATTTATIAAPSSKSPPVQDSPFSTYISNLSPIKPIKAAHAGQEFPGLFSPPLVFRSPRINLHRETILLKRIQCPQIPLSNDNRRGTQVVPVSNLLNDSNTQLSTGLGAEIEKEYDYDAKDSEQDQPCSSSGCVDKYLDDTMEADTSISAYSAGSCLNQSNDASQSLQSDFTGSNKTATGVFCGNTTTMDGKREVDASPALLLQVEEELQGKLAFNTKSTEKEEEQSGVERASVEATDAKSNSSIDYASEQFYECPVAQIAGGNQDEPDCNLDLIHETLHIPRMDENCAQQAGEIPNGSVENTILHDSEACQQTQHQRGMLRRCLQFEEVQQNMIANKPSCSYQTSTATSLRPPVTPCDLEFLESSCLELSTTSNIKAYSQPATTILPPQNSGNSLLAVSKPSGIGLHLNSIVNTLPIGFTSVASRKLDEKNYASAQRMSDSIPLSIEEKVSAGTKDRRNKNKASIATSSATSESPHGIEPSKEPFLLKPIELHETPCDKRKFKSEHVNSLEEFNQPSSAKKRKKSSTNDGDGCKRCNCKKSQCLKLYCDCFAAGVYCTEDCACVGCFNRPEYDDRVLETRKQIESRNPLAFAPRIVPPINGSPVNSGEDARSTPSSARHKRGCNCKKSMCLKKYCECYQANVGCSAGCRCEGCKNVYGRKEEYAALKEMNRRANDDRLESSLDMELEMAVVRNDFLCPELSNPHDVTPMTPSFQCTDHGNDAAKFQIPSQRYTQSPESDFSILSSYGKSPGSPKNSESHDILLETGNEIWDIARFGRDFEYGNTEGVGQFTPGYDRLSDVCHFTSLPNSLPTTAMNSSASSRISGLKNVSRNQLCPGSGHLISGGSCRWRSSSIPPSNQFGKTKVSQGPKTDNELDDMMEDDTPRILKDASTSTKAVKASSPKQKRVSPPRIRFHERGSSSSLSMLKTGRKFILQAVPSFPPLTPVIDAKSSSNQNSSDPQDISSNK